MHRHNTCSFFLSRQQFHTRHPADRTGVLTE